MTKWLATVMLSTAPLLALGAEVEGVDLHDTAGVGAQRLVLNGAGLRVKAFFRIYAAGL